MKVHENRRCPSDPDHLQFIFSSILYSIVSALQRSIYTVVSVFSFFFEQFCVSILSPCNLWHVFSHPFMGSFRITRHSFVFMSKRQWIDLLCLVYLPIDLNFLLVKKRFGNLKRCLRSTANIQKSHQGGQERRQYFLRANNSSIISVSWQNWFGFCFSQCNLTIFLQIFVILGFSFKGKQWTKFRNLIPYLYQHSIKTVVMLYTCNFFFADIKYLCGFRKLIIFL